MNNWNYHTNKLSNDVIVRHSILFSNTTINNKNPSIKITKTNNDFPVVKFIGLDGFYLIKFDDNEYEDFYTEYRNYPFDLVRKIKESKKKFF